MTGAIALRPARLPRIPRSGAAAISSLLLLAIVGPISAGISRGSSDEPVPVIVRAVTGAVEDARRDATAAGGKVGAGLPIIDGFTAKVPASALGRLRASASIHSVSPDTALSPLAHEWGLGALWGGDTSNFGTLSNVNAIIGADEAHRRGYTGRGVDVALLDTGVVPVEGLTTNVVNGPDLSFESQAPNLAYLDTNGHGTHMAGIIAGRDSGVDLKALGKSGNGFVGVAPGARLVSVKLATASGAVDVSQVIAALDWVVQHRRDNGLNIRVINLSYGTDGVQGFDIDPLAYAAEVAWRKGIVVVVAAGNNRLVSGPLNNPAHDPHLLAVGASDPHDTRLRVDDSVAPFSSVGDTRHPNLVAPGRSVLSLRNPGSAIDLEHPEAVVGERFFKGSGTSQAAAVVSGAAALLLEQRPWLTPNQVESLLTQTATPLADDPRAQGAGLIDVERALSSSISVSVTVSTGKVRRATGLGSLELARGSAHVADDGVELTGERDIFGPWDAAAWAAASWEERSWSGGHWNGNPWTGGCWCTETWAGPAWEARSWTGDTWAARSWTARSWTARSWTARSWTGEGWSGDTWLARSWTGLAWSAAH